MSKTYIILGGNGVFGVHTAIYLLRHANPKKVICVGRNPEKVDAFSLNVGRGDSRYNYHQIHIVHEQDRLFELFDSERPEVIINFAALAYATSWNKAWRYYETNLTTLARMTENLAARDYLKRWIQIGTSELYGSVDFPATEETLLRPTSPYAVSKAAGDMHLQSIVNVQNFPMNILRPSNAYGTGQQVYRVIPRLVLCGLTGQKMPLQGGGTVRKSYIHAQDLARAIHLIDEKAPLGTIYNAGPVSPVSIRELAERIASIIGVPFDSLVEMAPGRAGEDSQYWLDSSAIKRDVGWEPQIELTEGLNEMVEWGRQYLELLKSAPTEYTLYA